MITLEFRSRLWHRFYNHHGNHNMFIVQVTGNNVTELLSIGMAVVCSSKHKYYLMYLTLACPRRLISAQVSLNLSNMAQLGLVFPSLVYIALV